MRERERERERKPVLFEEEREWEREEKRVSWANKKFFFFFFSFFFIVFFYVIGSGIGYIRKVWIGEKIGAHATSVET